MDPSALITRHAPPEPSTEEEFVRHGALLADDEGLCALIDAIPELVMIVDPSRRVLLGNRALSDFAASQGCDAFIGMRPGELLACQHAPSTPAGCGTGEKCRTCGSIAAILAALAGDKASHESRILRNTPDGVEALDLKVWGNPFQWRGESLALVVAVDISDEKRRKVLERIFFHDILNTAGVISGLTDLLMQGVMTFDETKEHLYQMVQSLVSEIRSQRDLLAAENNELTVIPSPLHSLLFLDVVAGSYRKTPLGSVRKILLSPALDETIFYNDERLLGRVIGNLLKNALEASPEGGTVTLGCVVEGEEISFWCNNAGEIEPELQTQIFHRSFSTKEPGRGIGTYSVKLLTERYLKGRVKFSSSPEAGTTFTVTYPQDLRDR